MEIAAIASRTKETAQKMAQRYQIPDALTYEELVNRDDIDVVYVSVLRLCDQLRSDWGLKYPFEK